MILHSLVQKHKNPVAVTNISLSEQLFVIFIINLLSCINFKYFKICNLTFVAETGVDILNMQISSS